ncbi:glucose dehydrogenase [FAD, quinone]-like [Euwallacea similis]|uniref:glucose dehydrogenase [FAD, quinone]-like n=1 Tax=Euwallacea similis TaxID=1736056 RepID=UPI00344C02D8
MTIAKAIICLVLLSVGIDGSPFELLENYIDNFQRDVKHLQSYLSSKTIQTKSSEFVIEDHTVKDIGEYDFIIVGGGSSGSVIASRLSEIPEWRILLLEAGQPETTATKVPVMHSCLKGHSSPFTWGYYSTPQNYSCLNMEEKRCFIPTPKALGGTTAINDMLYTRGNARDYDMWADNGLKGWCWTSLSPYFKKIEDAHLECITDPASHRYGGPVHLENPRYPSSTVVHLLKAAEEIGLDEIDVNGKNSLGLGIPHLMAKNGQRFSTTDAYLQQAQNRKNLEIKPFTQVTKIIISEHTKEARAVKFIHEGHHFKASATKEIILAAGAVNTAKLLLLSGVGPQTHLQESHIEPVINLKVGENLIHHPMFPGLSFAYSDSQYVEPPFYYSKEIDYLRNGRGPLVANGVDVVGFIKTEHSKGRHLYPDVELLITSTQNDHPAELNRKLTVNLILLHPKSRGSLQLHTNDPLYHPFINLNDFSDKHDDDVETMLAAVKTIQKLMKSHHLEKLGLHPIHQKIHECDNYEPSDDYWRCAIKHLTVSTGEVTSSAPMGVDKDGHYGDSVVDLKLRVHGVEKLRVADDSVIPVSISGHLTAVKMVIGEKCADLIKEEWAK